MTVSNLWTAIASESGIASTQLAHGLSELVNVAPTNHWTHAAAFFPLATGLERMGKLYIVLDTLVSEGNFGKPRRNHNVKAILNEVSRRCGERYVGNAQMQRPDGGVETAVVTALSKFAESGRYHGLDTIASGEPNNKTDIPKLWYETVIVPVLARHHRRAPNSHSDHQRLDAALGVPSSTVAFRHVAGEAIGSLGHEIHSRQDYATALPWTRVYVMRTGRWLARVLTEIGNEARYEQRNDNVPDLSDFFRWTDNDDAHFRTSRKKFSMV